ncbi:MAG: MoaD/ThiS family protein [Planctomycetota bacterium]
MPKVRIPSPLRQYTDGADVIEINGTTVGEVLTTLTSNASGIETRLFKQVPTAESEGQLNRFVNIYVNDEDIRFMDDLKTPVKDSDEVSIVPAIAGGAE